MDDADLAHLVERAKQNDPDALDAIIDAYSARLFGFLYRLTGSREDAEDLLQEVFLRVVRCIGRYRHDGRFGAWLYRIATNLARDRLRRTRRRPVATAIGGTASGTSGGGRGEAGGPSDEELVDLSAPSPEGPLELREDVDALQRGLAQLSTAEREVIMLRHFTDLSFEEIAGAMGTPVGTALARAHRGLKKLRALIEESP